MGGRREEGSAKDCFDAVTMCPVRVSTPPI